MNWNIASNDNPPRSRSIRTFKIVAIILGGTLSLLVASVWLAAPKSLDQLVADGQTALANRNYSIARRHAVQAIAANPEMSSSWRLLAEAAALDGDRDMSVDALEKLAALQPAEASQLGLQIGRRWMLENRIRHAVRALHVAESTNPDALEPLRLQAQIAGVMGHPREVVRCVIELIKRNAFTRDDLIVIASANPITAEARRLEQIIETDPEARLNLLTYVMHAITLNRQDEAKRLLVEITSAHPDNAEAQGLLGEIYTDTDASQFLKWQAQLPAQADSDSRVWLARGKWLVQHGATDTAIRCLHEAVLREPEMLTANYLLGQQLHSVGERTLGEEFTQRGKRLQTIVGFSARMNDQRANDWIEPMIIELEAVGRLWEAWGWQRVQEQSMPRASQANTLLKNQLFQRLSMKLPRTAPESLPGKDFDWNRFPLPVWTEYQSPTDTVTSPHFSEPTSVIRFVDRADQSGLDFRFVTSSSPQQGRKIFETMGAGVAVLDYDLDGWPDLYFPQGSKSPRDPSAGPSDNIYRNQLGKHYLNVTESAGIQERAYSQGVAAGDFDNDGFPDVYVANLGKNCLYRNNGDGTFSDKTQQAGLKQTFWTVSCAIADLNGDGLPELFDANYVQGAKLFTGVCYDQHDRPGVCRPVVYDPAPDTAALNMGDGRFLEQQNECGLELPQGMGLGLIIADFNEDHRPDVFVANDMTANYLLINERSSPDQPLHFRDEAFLRGVALDQNGLGQACMGVACADINRDGLPDLLITNFAREFNTLYLSQPGGFYQDQIRAAGLSESSFEPLGFGTQFFDADHDGWYDLAVVNGHIDEIPNEPYRMKAQLFRGHADGRFEELFAETAGELFSKPRLGRGMALIDWNRDGRIDFVTTDLEDAVLLAENQTDSPGRRLRLKLVGTDSNRDGIGTRIVIRVTPTDERVIQITAGDGYEASNERMIDVGVGMSSRVEQVEILWPSGRRDIKLNVEIDSEWLAIEGRDFWWQMMRYSEH